MIQLFVALDQMRQQVKPDARIHGVITKGGDQANIIPEHTARRVLPRAPTPRLLQGPAAEVRGRAEGAAQATGCTAKVMPDDIIHDPLKPNFTMAALFRQNLEHRLPRGPGRRSGAATAPPTAAM
jgi:metal-dependent amidase/aminoacylase/carboxypeptidase family protein